MPTTVAGRPQLRSTATLERGEIIDMGLRNGRWTVLGTTHGDAVLERYRWWHRYSIGKKFLPPAEDHT